MKKTTMAKLLLYMDNPKTGQRECYSTTASRAETEMAIEQIFEPAGYTNIAIRKDETKMEVMLNGKKVDFDTCIQLMDDELKEKVHRRLAPCTPQEFIKAYNIEHFKRYGEDFEIY